RALEASREPIATLIEEQRLEDLPGIGVALRMQIEELHRTGTSELLESLRAGLPAGALEIAQVGVGLHAIRTLHDELGIKSIDELERAAREGRLREANGFGPKKEAKILEAVAKYRAGGSKILLADGLRLAAELEREIGEVV